MVRKTKPGKRELAAERERAYQSAYASTGNVLQAQIEAGYKPHTNVPIKATRDEMLTAIVRDINQATIDVGCTPRAIMELLWDCAQHAYKSEERKQILPFIQELNRMCGNYVPHQQQKMTINVDTTLEKLTEARKVYKDY